MDAVITSGVRMYADQRTEIAGDYIAFTQIMCSLYLKVGDQECFRALGSQTL